MPEQIQDESEFENSSPAPKNRPVASHKKHAYNKTILSPSSSHISKTDPSPSKVIGSNVSAQEIPLGTIPTIPDKLPARDRVNNLTQKEIALEKVGVTRKKAYQRIYEALEAVKTVEYRDSSGNVLYKTEPDWERNKWGAEMALKAFGDLIERKEVEYGVGDSTLSRFKELSVAQLKARAVELLLGKAVSRLPAIDISTEGTT